MCEDNIISVGRVHLLREDNSKYKNLYIIEKTIIKSYNF